jgi:uncharacterized membrane protein YozB (DUF420 family)
MFGTRAGVLVDLFLVVLLLVLPALLVAVALVRRGRVKAHAAIMRGSFFAFLAAVVAFEIEVRFKSKPPLALVPLAIHLCFALPALGLWAFQILRGQKALADPVPHRRRGRILLALLSLTVATGFWLYAEVYLLP